MKHSLLRLLVAAAVICGLSSAAIASQQGKSASRRTEITQTINAFVSAWNRNNVHWLVSLFMQHGAFLSPTGADAHTRPHIRRLLMQEHQEIFTGTTLSANIQSISFPQQGHAVARGSYTLSGVNIFLGFEIAVEGSFTFRFVRKDGEWLIETARISKS